MKMPEYITKEQAISVVTASTDYDEEWLVEDIKELPPADVAPVVHGQNISNVHPSDRFKCSQCGLILEDYTECEDEEDNSWVEFTAWNYCPRCGARMDGDDKPQKEIPEEKSTAVSRGLAVGIARMRNITIADTSET